MFINMGASIQSVVYTKLHLCEVVQWITTSSASLQPLFRSIPQKCISWLLGVNFRVHDLVWCFCKWKNISTYYFHFSFCCGQTLNCVYCILSPKTKLIKCIFCYSINSHIMKKKLQRHANNYINTSCSVVRIYFWTFNVFLRYKHLMDWLTW